MHSNLILSIRLCHWCLPVLFLCKYLQLNPQRLVMLEYQNLALKYLGMNCNEESMQMNFQAQFSWQ